MNKIAVNEKVAITALSFRQKGELETFPKKMEYQGTTYTFLDGLQCLIRKGQEIIRVFDMTDGQQNFRLKCGHDQSDWTLVAMTQNV